jgi:UDP-glucose:glycoprotein glucosyltransferase
MRVYRYLWKSLQVRNKKFYFSDYLILYARSGSPSRANNRRILRTYDSPLSSIPIFPQVCNLARSTRSCERKCRRRASQNHNNSVKVQKGVNAFWFNGAHTDTRDVNPFALLRLLKKERTVVQSLMSCGLSNLQTFELLTHPAVASSQKDSGMTEAVFDASDRPEGGDLIVWWNDMEKDSR